MSAELQFDFLVDKDASKLTIRREFAAKRQLVWDCHTKSELLDQWFAPKPLTTKTASMDFREGGHWHYAMLHEGQEYWSRLDYQTIHPVDTYTALDGFCDASAVLNPDLPRAHWDVTFSDKAPQRTLVETVVSYASADGLQQVLDMGMQEGLTSTLQRLDELLVVLNQPENS